MKKLVTKTDFILLVIVLLVGISGIAVMNGAENGKTAIVSVDGETVETIALDGENGVYTFNNVVIRLKNGEIYVESSDCADKVCMHSGKISKSGESIICVPNRVAVEISGKSDTLPDAVTG